jgi:hypothetical protein
LSYAAEHNKVAVVRTLLELGVDPNAIRAPAGYGSQSLEHVFHRPIIELLRQYGHRDLLINTDVRLLVQQKREEEYQRSRKECSDAISAKQKWWDAKRDKFIREHPARVFFDKIFPFLGLVMKQYVESEEFDWDRHINCPLDNRGRPITQADISRYRLNH